jgi:hypothetical protein
MSEIIDAKRSIEKALSLLPFYTTDNQLLAAVEKDEKYSQRYSFYCEVLDVDLFIGTIKLTMDMNKATAWSWSQRGIWTLNDGFMHAEVLLAMDTLPEAGRIPLPPVEVNA